MKRRRTRRNPMPARSARTGRFLRSGARRNPTAAKAATPKRAKRVGSKTLAVKRARGRALAKRLAKREVSYATQSATAMRPSLQKLKGLQRGDRVIVWRHGKTVPGMQINVGGVRPRDNPGKRRRKHGAAHRVVIHTAHGTKSFMARGNPSHSFGGGLTLAQQENVRRAMASGTRRSRRKSRGNPMPRRSSRTGRFVRG